VHRVRGSRFESRRAGRTARRSGALTSDGGGEALSERLDEERVAAVLRAVVARAAAARGLPLGPLERAGYPFGAGAAAGAGDAAAGEDADGPEALGRAYEALLEEAGRRGAGAHYTPAAVARPLVAAVLDAALGPAPTSAAVLDLTVVDPAAGAGAFLLEAGRGLAGRLEAAWRREGVAPADPARAARRRVACACLHGVDVDPRAVALARRALWLFAADADLPAAAFDAALRVGDAVVGVSRAQAAAFSAAPAGPAPEGLDPDRTAAAADLLVRALWQGERAAARVGPAARAWLRDGGPLPASLAALAALPGPAGPPLHWELAFPGVFARGGFAAVLSNPPFGNAIERATARSRGLKSFAAAVHGPFARGAYDGSLLFWARALRDLLRPDGVYGLVGPTALLSASGPWQAWVHARWRPRALTLHPPDAFPAARVRTTAVVGGAGPCPAVVVADREVGAEPVRVAWADGPADWYAVVGGADSVSAASGVPTRPLGELLEVHAGCATRAAYELRPVVRDDPAGPGPRLVTTGAIDRYACRWGARPIRYLGRDYAAPRWPAGPDAPPRVARARDRQDGPKLLVGGLTAVLEAWLDRTGDAAGVVSTWVVRPGAATADAPDADVLLRAAGLLNSATLARRYLERFGGRSMNGRQTTILKRGLLATALPADLAAPRGPGPLPRAPAPTRDRARLWAHLERLAAALGADRPDAPGRVERDALAHRVAGLLLGRDPAGADDDYLWWCGRARAPRCPLAWTALVAADAAV